MTNPVLIALESADQPEVSALIDALDAYQKPLYPPESHHGIDLAALTAPNVLFAVARDADGTVLGCAALVLSSEYGELKRMVTEASHRRRGVARSLLQFLESEAQARGCRHFALETGVRQLEALSFYEQQGYVRCAPFGNYVADPHSEFMRKMLPDAGTAPREFSVWRARSPDIAAVAPLFDAYRQFYGRKPDAQLAERFLHERLTQGESVVLLARDAAGNAAGFVQLYPLFSSVRAARGYLLNDLYVIATQRRRGVGRLLLEAAAEFARASGAARLKLFTAKTNASAQRLYESLGWVRDDDYLEYNRDI